ncbi:STAS domain-containing protein [Streptomyces sp. NPDC048664]|uniref:STAS domain-containing protein n=1 Tax=Streptomyces sp. NPDC048664 TaxID=3154505 RepID=UPI00343E528B
MSAEKTPLSIDVATPREGVALVTVEGYLDVDTATELHYHLANQMHHGRRHLLLDLSSVPFMDSSGINIVLRAYKETRQADGSIGLIDPTPAVRRILDLTGVSLTVPSFGSADDALAAVEAPTEPPISGTPLLGGVDTP